MGRILREYEHVAYKEHRCDICQTSIRPGDLYRGSVSLNRMGGINVWKEHHIPFCPEEFWEEEERMMNEAIDRADKKAKKEWSKKAPSRKAA